MASSTARAALVGPFASVSLSLRPRLPASSSCRSICANRRRTIHSSPARSYQPANLQSLPSKPASGSSEPQSTSIRPTTELIMHVWSTRNNTIIVIAELEGRQSTSVAMDSSEKLLVRAMGAVYREQETLRIQEERGRRAAEALRAQEEADAAAARARARGKSYRPPEGTATASGSAETEGKGWEHSNAPAPRPSPPPPSPLVQTTVLENGTVVLPNPREVSAAGPFEPTAGALPGSEARNVLQGHMLPPQTAPAAVVYNAQSTGISDTAAILKAMKDDSAQREERAALAEFERLIRPARPHSRVLGTFTTGKAGFKRIHKKSYEAAYTSAIMAIDLLNKLSKVYELRLEVHLAGFGNGREAVVQALQGVEAEELRPQIRKLVDSTPIKIGGPRAKKRRKF